MRIKFILIIFFTLLFTGRIFPQNITNTLGTSGIFTIKDGTTTFATLNQSSGYMSLNKSLTLVNTTGSTFGVIFKGADRFIHNYGTGNMFIGINSGNFTMTGGYNTAVGYQSFNSGTTGSNNTAFGYYSLKLNTIGSDNTAIGYFSLVSNISGNLNTALGSYSLTSNSTGYFNTALGYYSLGLNTTGYENTAVGMYSLLYNTYGRHNTAVGYQSLKSNINGIQNTAVGVSSLQNNISGLYNTAVGYQSLFNSTGNYNTALGNVSLINNISGTQNTAVGYQSLFLNTNGWYNTATGYNSLYSNTGDYNTAFGYSTGSTITTGYNLTCLGKDAQPTSGTATNQITLGNSAITSLRCNVTTISSLSDKRDKKNISDLNLGINFLMKIKPRLFNWDKREWYEDNNSDGTKMLETPTAGFIAQELDEAQTNGNAEWLNLVLKDNPEKLEATPGNLLPIVVKAIQDLKTENDELKERLNKLEMIIHELKNKDNNNLVKNEEIIK